MLTWQELLAKAQEQELLTQYHEYLVLPVARDAGILPVDEKDDAAALPCLSSLLLSISRRHQGQRQFLTSSATAAPRFAPLTMIRRRMNNHLQGIVVVLQQNIKSNVCLYCCSTSDCNCLEIVMIATSLDEIDVRTPQN